MPSGWLTTKKRGRDDKAIAQAAAKAKAARKPKKKGAAANQPKPKPKKKPKDNFIASDESEIEEFSLSDEDSESEDGFGSVSFNNKHRTSKPPPALTQRLYTKNKKASRVQTKKTNKPSPVEMEWESEEEEDDDYSCASDSEDDTVQRKPKAKPVVHELGSDSSGDDDDSATKDGLVVANQKKASNQQSAIEIASTEDEDDEPIPPKRSNKRPPSSTQEKGNGDSSHDDNDDAVQQKPAKKRSMKHTLFDSDDDDRDGLNGASPLFVDATTSHDLVDTPAAVRKKKPFKKKKKPSSGQEDSCSDEDEKLALEMALKESKQQAEEKELVDLQDTDDEEQDDDDNYEETAETASSILRIANDLSEQIIKKLSGWGTTEGLIVDNGAIAMHSKSEKADWIVSPQLAKEILPNVKLADYQLIGVNWMALLHGMQCGVAGSDETTNVNGILADEMGLGKTCQTIAFLAYLKHKKLTKLPHLVIAPSSVLSNWINEFRKFAPQLNVVKYHGDLKERGELQGMLRSHLPGKRNPSDSLDVILAPITYFQRETSDDRSFLRKFKYDFLVVDEAHLLKNARGTRYSSLTKFSSQHRLLLTGTPVQNSPKELMALLCFLMPLFSRHSSEFKDDNKGGIEGLLEHFVSAQGKGVDDRTAYAKLKQVFSPFVLRRRKRDVLSQIMPPKTHQVEFVDLEPEGRALYDSVLENHVHAKKKGTASLNDHLFTQLRKASHHPLLLRSRHTSSAEREHLARCFLQFGAFRGEGCTMEKVHDEVAKFSDFDVHLVASELLDDNPLRRDELGRYILDEQDLFSSAKFVRLRKILPPLLEEGHRVLIFSVWTNCLDLLGCLLEQLGIGYLRMDGSTDVSERQGLIDKFNDDATIPVFLLSTKACGLGINLTAADTCIMHDLDFNPFNDLQAEDRCHRIGQKRAVKIIKLVTRDTVDYAVYEMQERKSKMNAAILDNEADWKKHAEKKKKMVVKKAVEDFIKSPNGKVTAEKENAQENDDDDGESI